MVQIKWTNQAKDDLKNIYDYISMDSVKYAQLQVVKLKQKTSILKNQPLSGHIVPEISNDEIRQLIEGRYRIVYKVVNKERVDIITIHHSSRDFLRRISKIV